MHKFAAVAVSGLLAASIAMPAFAAGRMTSESSPTTNMRQGPSRRSLKATPVRQKNSKNTIKHEPKMTEWPKNLDVGCAKAAFATRETALSAAFTVFASSVTTAHTTRAAAINSAWNGGDEARKGAIQAAWDAFAKSVKTARETMKTSKQDAWTAFRKAAKACAAGEGTEEGAETIDAGI